MRNITWKDIEQTLWLCVILGFLTAIMNAF
jgi:hypothetical protein